MFTLVNETGGHLAVGSDNKTYTSLGYTNGPGGLTGARPDLRGVDTTDKVYRTQATVRKSSETHGVEDVGKCHSNWGEKDLHLWTAEQPR